MTLRIAFILRGRGASQFYTIPTPSLSLGTVTVDRPFPLIVTISQYPVGLYDRLELASDAGFTTPLSGRSEIIEERQLTVSDITDDDVDGTVESDTFASMAGLPAQLIYARMTLGRESDDGLSITWGTPSNVVSMTVTTLQPSTFDPANKSLYIDLSAADLTMTNQLVGVGVHGVARLTNYRGGKRYGEFSVDALPTDRVGIGLGPSDFDWDGAAHTNLPGSAAVTDGISFENDGQVACNGSYSYILSAWQVNDRICFSFDEPNDKAWFGISRSGTRTWNGDPGAGTGGFTLTGMDQWFAYAAAYIKGGDQRVISWVPDDDLAHAPPTTFTGYDAA